MLFQTVLRCFSCPNRGYLKIEERDEIVLWFCIIFLGHIFQNERFCNDFTILFHHEKNMLCFIFPTYFETCKSSNFAHRNLE